MAQRDVIDSFSGEYLFLSNFHIDGLAPGLTLEHRFQSAKAVIYERQLWILAADNPSLAKRRGRRVEIRADWDFIKDDVMLALLRHKFTAPYYRDKLLETGDAELIEGNTWGDVYWGTCRGQGQNKLGRLLMQVRREAQRGTA